MRSEYWSSSPVWPENRGVNVEAASRQRHQLVPVIPLTKAEMMIVILIPRTFKIVKLKMWHGVVVQMEQI